MLFAAAILSRVEGSIPYFDDKPVYIPPRKDNLIKLKAGQLAFRIDSKEKITQLKIDSYNPNDKAIILARSMKRAIKKTKKRMDNELGLNE